MKNLKETIQENNKNNFAVKIYDYLNSEWIYIGSEKTYDEAYKLHNKSQFDYYLNKRYLLPKGIALDIKKEKFIFVIWHNNKTILQKRYDSLQQAKKAKQDFINKLID